MNVAAMTPRIPSSLPVLPCAAVAGRYVITGGGVPRGGQDMDAWAMPDGRVVLALADVLGGGPEADCGAAEAQAILRERLAAGVGLLEAVSSLDRYAAARPSLECATLCVAVMDLQDGSVEWFTAGQAAPLLVDSSGAAALLGGGGGQPLGESGSRVVTHRAHIEQDDILCLLSDGLVLRPGRTRADGEERIRRAAKGAFVGLDAIAPAQRAEEFCDRLLRSVVGPDVSADDAALLAVRRSAPQPTFAMRFPAIPEVLPEVRHRINRWLDDLGAGLVDHVGLGHAVVELAANVVEHAYVARPDPDPEVLVEARHQVDGTVCIRVSDRGRWRANGVVGHGLATVSGMVEAMAMSRSVNGTTVELTQALSRPVPLLRAVVAGGPDGAMPVLEESVELGVEESPGRLEARGAVDDVSVEVLRSALVRVTRAGTADAIIDLSGLTQLDRVGVQLLFEFGARCARTGSRLTLHARPGSMAAEHLTLVGLLDAW